MSTARQEGNAVGLSTVTGTVLRRSMQKTLLDEQAMKRIDQIVLSNHIEAIERQIIDLRNKDTNVYGRPLDDAGKKEVQAEIAELQKRIASLKNQLRKVS